MNDVIFFQRKQSKLCHHIRGIFVKNRISSILIRFASRDGKYLIISNNFGITFHLLSGEVLNEMLLYHFVDENSGGV